MRCRLAADGGRYTLKKDLGYPELFVSRAPCPYNLSSWGGSLYTERRSDIRENSCGHLASSSLRASLSAMAASVAAVAAAQGLILRGSAGTRRSAGPSAAALPAQLRGAAGARSLAASARP